MWVNPTRVGLQAEEEGDGEGVMGVYDTRRSGDAIREMSAVLFLEVEF